jgi:hypothetical protein
MSESYGLVPGAGLSVVVVVVSETPGVAVLMPPSVAGVAVTDVVVVVVDPASTAPAVAPPVIGVEGAVVVAPVVVVVAAAPPGVGVLLGLLGAQPTSSDAVRSAPRAKSLFCITSSFRTGFRPSSLGRHHNQLVS